MENFTKHPFLLSSPFELLPDNYLEAVELPLVHSRVAAGFPSPADDYTVEVINLQNFLIKDPDSSYLVKVMGNSMVDARLHDGDILIVDRSLLNRSIKTLTGNVIIGKVNGEFTVKRLICKDQKYYLQPANEAFSALEITEDMDFQAWGVVTWAIHKIKH
ncbi:LexA family transcriptional regulator [Pontibacter sp. SGAir0037]|uniref:LexA family protein n=1 Tax=Pontibacter sp. SGAir0037 TaxID=2571030 RepID=UPI0010CD2C2A|nr:translesion error-prone DNA polymerase V autoproteolytic subunit [Pontibacter sp. SGAir0037]QCR24899.1 peptidase S24 [Pontibacter sp. SGAir0037]